MTRTTRQPYNATHPPPEYIKERLSRNGYSTQVKPVDKKNGAGKANWGSPTEAYELWNGAREEGIKVTVVAHDIGMAAKKRILSGR
ncbi:hypothetical protein HDU79_001936 [Rhizoclosmatium sp. JEL0117]|nr:hypothetical protein HDU79_001936 [Rhizoclosmatium sp. JEL0117]